MVNYLARLLLAGEGGREKSSGPARSGLPFGGPLRWVEEERSVKEGRKNKSKKEERKDQGRERKKEREKERKTERKKERKKERKTSRNQDTKKSRQKERKRGEQTKTITRRSIHVSLSGHCTGLRSAGRDWRFWG